MRKFLLFLSFMMGISSYAQTLNSSGITLRTNTVNNMNEVWSQETFNTTTCGFETLSNNFETSLGSLKNYKIANDFVVTEEMGVFSLETIKFHAFVEPGGEISEVNYIFHEDSPAGPGNILYTLENTAVTSVTTIGQYEDENGVKDVKEVYVELSDPLIFQGDATNPVFWLSVQVPNYQGSSISFELITNLDSPNGTYAFLAGSWHDIEGLFGVVRDGVMSLTGTCSSSVACTEVSVEGLEGPNSVCALNEFMITPIGATSGVTGLSYTWEMSPIDQDNWSIIEGANALNLVMENGINEPTKFRLNILCESGNSATSPPMEILINTAEDCYCIPEFNVGCTDGDIISSVKIETLTGDLVYLNESGCAENAYAYYTQENEMIELTQGETYNFTISTASETPENEEVEVWIDMNKNGVFEPEESIGATNGVGMGTNGEFSFEYTVSEDAVMFSETFSRLRVRLAWMAGENLASCETRSYGETEDYKLMILDDLGVKVVKFDNFKFYPNPVKDIMKLVAQETINEVALYDITGKKILQQSPKNPDVELNTRHLTKGVYIMNVTIGDKSKSFRIIKE